MLPTLWRLFWDKMFKVHFELQQQWHIGKRKGISYTQCQRQNNILQALYYLQPQGKMLPTLWQLFRDKTFEVQFGPQQQWRNDKRKGISYTQCQRMNNIHHALYYLQPQRKMLPTLWPLFGDKAFNIHFDLQQQWLIDKRKGISCSQCQRMNNIHHAL